MAKQKETPTSVDLDETAELPILPGNAGIVPADDPLAATDAYNSPTLFRAPPSEATADSPTEINERIRNDETHEQYVHKLRELEIGALRSDLASVQESRGQLESNLGKLTNNLRELEQMLNRKSEQLSMFEREVGLRDRRIAELESRAATMDGERAATAAERDALRSDLGQARADGDAARQMLQEHSARIAELESRTATMDGQLAATTAERDSLRSDLRQAREDTNAARQMLQEHSASASALLKEKELQTRRLRVLEADLAQARALAERYRERLQSQEGRRQIFTSMLDEQETQIVERSTTVARLQAEITEHTTLNSGREKELKASLATERERVRQLEQAQIIARAEQEAQREAAVEAAKAADERHRAVLAEVADQQKAMSKLRGELDAALKALNERNELIDRIDSEMASSSQVLGSIQHNLEHLGDAEPVRMLVRTSGETGIVQLLGRRTTLGRTPDNDIRIDEDFISRHHAVVLLAGASTVVEDLNSTNGTYVNAERVNRKTLKEGDLVTLGKTEFRFVVKRPTDKPA